MALLMLAMHKNVQENVVRELRGVFTAADDAVNYEALNGLPYLEMVIKETMRLFPVTPFTLRTSTHDFQLDGFQIPARSHFLLSIFSLHRDASFWGDDAELFRPERFQPGQIKNLHPYAFVPFSGDFNIGIHIKRIFCRFVRCCTSLHLGALYCSVLYCTMLHLDAL